MELDLLELVDNASGSTCRWEVCVCGGGSCNKGPETFVAQAACFESVLLLLYSRPPVTTRHYKIRPGLDCTRLLSALASKPSAAQLWVIRKACSRRAPLAH